MLGMVFKLGGNPVDFKIQFVDIAPLFFIREIEFRAAIFQHMIAEGGLVVLIGIGPEVKPDKAEGVGGVIDVFELFKTGEAVVFVVKGDFDGIVGFLLPVVWVSGVRCQLTGSLHVETG